MITVRLKKNYTNRAEAIRDVLDIAGPENAELFEYMGKEKIKSPDPDARMRKELERLGLRPMEQEEK